MQPRSVGIIVPSKLYGVLQTEAPVLFVGPEDADTAYELQKFGRGRSLPTESDGRLVAGALDKLAQSQWKQESLTDMAGVDRIAVLLCAS